MRLSVASAVLAATFVLTLVAAGNAPALSQDFSITNKVENVAPADAGRRDLMRQLQAWWNVHAYCPKEASQSDQGGTVKVHMVIHPDGVIWMVDVAESAGSRALDRAATLAFRGGFVRPFAAGPTAPEADLVVSLHYVLTHRHDQPVTAAAPPVVSRSAFTITSDPIGATIVTTMLQRTCTGTVVRDGLRNHPAYGWHSAATPVTEVGKLAQWTGRQERIKPAEFRYARYAVWPDGDNHLIGDVADPRRTVDFTCATETIPAITSNAWLENPPPSWPQADVRE